MTSFARLTDYPPSHPSIKDDMDRRYQHTYMTMVDKTTKDIIPVLYHGASKSTFVFTDIQGNYIELPYSDKTEVNILLPKTGYYNLRGNPIYIIKAPQRQWKRSFCSSIYKILSPYKDDNLPERLPASAWFTLAKESLSPTYASLDDIKKEIFASIALNNKFAIAKDVNDIACLLYKRHKVGHLEFKGRSVIVTQPLLMQEVRDLFKYTGVTTWNLHQTQAE